MFSYCPTGWLLPRTFFSIFACLSTFWESFWSILGCLGLSFRPPWIDLGLLGRSIFTNVADLGGPAHFLNLFDLSWVLSSLPFWPKCNNIKLKWSNMAHVGPLRAQRAPWIFIVAINTNGIWTISKTLFFHVAQRYGFRLDRFWASLLPLGLFGKSFWSILRPLGLSLRPPWLHLGPVDDFFLPTWPFFAPLRSP